ncbi:TolB family protein [Streptosporangium sp. CA-115845]|uniref:TolB family protein n=1 Tax=Streptosporangium sp. CA-115845 TaxID=3240071 RepID=UPI003D9299DA
MIYARGKPSPTTYSTYYDIYLRRTEDCEEVQLTDTPGMDNTGPRLSPDGSKIVFSSERDGDAEIFIMATDGTNLTQVTRNETTDIEPDWAADDSSRIIFTGFRNNTYGLYTINSSGRDERWLNLPYARHSDWSTRGKIAFVSHDGTQRVFIMNSDGTDRQAITEPGNYRHPVWSPDGEKLAYATPGGISVQERPGSGVPPRAVFNRAVEGPAWSPDALWLAVVKFENHLHTVLHVGVDGNGEVTDFLTGANPVIDVEWGTH